MFNFHIGLPGLASDLLSSVSQADVFKTGATARVMPQERWREQFRGLVNTEGADPTSKIKAVRTAERAIADWAKDGAVAISQHALLGAPEDCFLKEKPLPHADARIERVSELFASVPLTFHIAVQNQLDYLLAAMNRRPESRIAQKLRTIPSWSQLALRIKMAAPGRQIIVWDMEQPNKTTLAFAISMLDVSDSASIIIQNWPRARIMTQSNQMAGNLETQGLSSDLVDRLDAQYDLDLEEISQIEGVSLVLPQNVPDELHL